MVHNRIPIISVPGNLSLFKSNECNEYSYIGLADFFLFLFQESYIDCDFFFRKVIQFARAQF